MSVCSIWKCGCSPLATEVPLVPGVYISRTVLRSTKCTKSSPRSAYTLGYTSVKLRINARLRPAYHKDTTSELAINLWLNPWTNTSTKLATIRPRGRPRQDKTRQDKHHIVVRILLEQDQCKEQRLNITHI